MEDKQLGNHGDDDDGDGEDEDDDGENIKGRPEEFSEMFSRMEACSTDDVASLAQDITALSRSANDNDLSSFRRSIINFTHNIISIVCHVTGAADRLRMYPDAQQPPLPPLHIDQSQLVTSQQAIQSACSTLQNLNNTQQQILSSASLIARHTSAVCNICRLTSTSTEDPVAKKLLVQHARNVANNTAALVRAIKILDADKTETNMDKCNREAVLLLQSLQELIIYVQSYQHGGRDVLLKVGHSMIDNACNLFTSAVKLTSPSKDHAYFQDYSQNSHHLSESIKSLLLLLRDNMPGCKQCSDVIRRADIWVNKIDQACLTMNDDKQQQQQHGETPSSSSSSSHLMEVMNESIGKIVEQVEVVMGSERKMMDGWKEEVLGRLVSPFSDTLDELIVSSISYTRSLVKHETKMLLLQQTKTVVEAMQNFLSAVKELMEAHDELKESLDELKETIGQSHQQLLHHIQSSSSSLSSPLTPHREIILRTAKTLVENTKHLVSSVACNSQQVTTGAAESSVLTMTQLAECVKGGVACLGGRYTQQKVLLINAIRDVAVSLSNLIEVTKNASNYNSKQTNSGNDCKGGAGGDDDTAGGADCDGKCMEALRNSAKVMVNNVTALLKTVKMIDAVTSPSANQPSVVTSSASQSDHVKQQQQHNSNNNNNNNNVGNFHKQRNEELIGEQNVGQYDGDGEDGDDC
ncbi:hypothetical protein HELRODRAFT_193464 [Helobdella robusta]|uniref:I/LWEQ domain-containing protein n=1 Tax=Helobdella robusta TaxID=6412 RepID=T1FV08_HELRO|nr:hypothetical protein HELRODRAFT_193464 [Helobdella robusta]ESN95995.1 hypothetical protein HELRODRAFT_193464 [Helobdella robusta]